MALSDAERQAKKRWYDRGYALQPGPPPEEQVNVGAWCEGVWQRHADNHAAERAKKRATLPKQKVVPAPS